MKKPHKSYRKPTFEPGDCERHRLSQQVALITGACGQLGRRFCESLGSLGAHIIVSDVNPYQCAKQADELKKSGIHASFLVMDVGDPESVRNAFSAVRRIDVLVNAAAIAVFSPFEERTFEDFMAVLRTNVGGVFLTSQQAARIMKKQKAGGRIINIASIYGMVSSDPSIYTDCERRNSEVYSASKAAVIQLSRYLAIHLAPYKIRVNCVSPGGVRRNQGKDFIKNYSRKTALGRMAEDKEIAASIQFLATESSSYITGHNLVVDGGFTAW